MPAEHAGPASPARVWRRLGAAAASAAESAADGEAFELSVLSFMLAIVGGLLVVRYQEQLRGCLYRALSVAARPGYPSTEDGRPQSPRRRRGDRGLDRASDDDPDGDHELELQAMEARRRQRQLRSAAADKRKKPGRASPSSCVGSAAGVSVAGSLPGDVKARLHSPATHLLPRQMLSPLSPPPFAPSLSRGKGGVASRAYAAAAAVVGGYSPKERRARRRQGPRIQWGMPLTQLTTYTRGNEGDAEDDGRPSKPLRKPQSPYRRRTRRAPVRLLADLVSASDGSGGGSSAQAGDYGRGGGGYQQGGIYAEAGSADPFRGSLYDSRDVQYEGDVFENDDYDFDTPHPSSPRGRGAILD